MDIIINVRETPQNPCTLYVESVSFWKLRGKYLNDDGGNGDLCNVIYYKCLWEQYQSCSVYSSEERYANPTRVYQSTVIRVGGGAYECSSRFLIIVIVICVRILILLQRITTPSENAYEKTTRCTYYYACTLRCDAVGSIRRRERRRKP